MARSWLALGAGIASMTLATAACGGSNGGSSGGSSVSADSWARSVCTSFQTWTGALSKQPEALQNPTGSLTNQQIKDELSSYLGSAVRATQTLADSIRSAGSPAVENGSAAAAELASGLQPIQRSFEDAKSKVDAASTTDAESFKSALDAVGTQLNSSGDQAKSSFDSISKKYSGGALDRAFTSEPACKQLNGK